MAGSSVYPTTQGSPIGLFFYADLHLANGRQAAVKIKMANKAAIINKTFNKN